MQVLQKKTAPPAKRGLEARPIAQYHTFPAPKRGWVLNENIAAPGPEAAAILDNWVPTTKGVRVRGGSAKYANLGAAVTSIFSYESGLNTALFAATDAAIYDITVVADEEVTPAAAISGQNSGKYSTAQFGTAGSDYLYAVNGTDNAQLYDGTSWQAVTGASSPISVTGVDTSTLSYVWSYANRLFFIEDGGMSAWYLPVDSLGGAASEFSLQGVFREGGELLFGGTWSQDSGAGLDDKCVFFSDQGEAAVYEGTNPGSASDWRLVGVYNITDPIGPFGTMQAGGDLLIATRSGFVPLSEAVRRDAAALAMAAVSAPIAPYWQEAADVADAVSWEILKWPEKNYAVISQPNAQEASCLVVNLQTGAWSRFLGWDTQCLGNVGPRSFFGSADGYVREMEVGGSDSGGAYTCAYLGQHEGLAAPGLEKTVLQMRPIFQSATSIAPQVEALTNYATEIAAAPSAAAETGTAGWDVGVWDTMKWDEAAVSKIGGDWRSVGRTGWVVAPELQLTFNNILLPSVELVAIDATYDVGAGVV